MKLLRMNSKSKEASICMTKMVASFISKTFTTSLITFASTFVRKTGILTTRVYLICTKRRNRLGQGGYGSVYLLRHRLNDELTAAKFVGMSLVSLCNPTNFI